MSINFFILNGGYIVKIATMILIKLSETVRAPDRSFMNNYRCLYYKWSESGSKAWMMCDGAGDESVEHVICWCAGGMSGRERG